MESELSALPLASAPKAKQEELKNTSHLSVYSEKISLISFLFFF